MPRARRPCSAPEIASEKLVFQKMDTCLVRAVPCPLGGAVAALAASETWSASPYQSDLPCMVGFTISI